MNRIKLALCVTLLSIISGCASHPPQETGSQAPEGSKVEQLAAYQPTVIQTSNGPIEVEPTVVASTDANTDPTLPAGESYYDPLETVNRAIFTFNHYSYEYVLIPVAKGYNFITPKPVQQSISNVFDNIREPLNLINNLLTADFAEVGSNLGRFLVNSTIGIFGLFDPADAWFGIEKKPQTFAQTLMRYDVNSGPYIVLPILGQSDVRGTTSVITEGLIHPLNYVLDTPESSYARVIDGVDDFAKQAELYNTLFEQASDPYIYFRNQYIQAVNRNDKAIQPEINITGASNDESR